MNEINQIIKKYFEELAIFRDKFEEFSYHDNRFQKLSDQENKNESIKKRLKFLETYFDNLHENYLRIDQLNDAMMKLEKVHSEMTHVIASQMKKIMVEKEQIGNKMNETLLRLKSIEKVDKGFFFSKDFEKKQYTDYMIETEEQKRQNIQQQKQMNEMERKRNEKIK